MIGNGPNFEEWGESGDFEDLAEDVLRVVGNAVVDELSGIGV